MQRTELLIVFALAALALALFWGCCEWGCQQARGDNWVNWTTLAALTNWPDTNSTYYVWEMKGWLGDIRSSIVERLDIVTNGGARIADPDPLTGIWYYADQIESYGGYTRTGLLQMVIGLSPFVDEGLWGSVASLANMEGDTNVEVWADDVLVDPAEIPTWINANLANVPTNAFEEVVTTNAGAWFWAGLPYVTNRCAASLINAVTNEYTYTNYAVGAYQFPKFKALIDPLEVFGYAYRTVATNFAFAIDNRQAWEGEGLSDFTDTWANAQAHAEANFSGSNYGWGEAGTTGGQTQRYIYKSKNASNLYQATVIVAAQRYHISGWFDTATREPDLGVAVWAEQWGDEFADHGDGVSSGAWHILDGVTSGTVTPWTCSITTDGLDWGDAPTHSTNVNIGWQITLDQGLPYDQIKFLHYYTNDFDY
jgi:hypothetical protein